MMGTTVTITVYARQDDGERAIDAAFDRMAEIEAIASRFDPSSEVSRLNAEGRLDDPSSEILDMVRISMRYGEITGGAFDITVMPLIDLWGSEANGTPFWALNASEQQPLIDRTLDLVGYDMIEVGPNGSYIAFGRANMSITLDGIAKGYAVDEGLRVLRDRGIDHALINAGGDIAVFGGKPRDDPWVIGLEDLNHTGDYFTVVEFDTMAIASSGNYLRFYDPEQRVGHILDPATGRSATASWSTHIIAPNCTTADVLATATFVMGADDGIALVNTLPEVEGLVLDSTGNITVSAGYADYGPVKDTWRVVG